MGEFTHTKTTTITPATDVLCKEPGKMNRCAQLSYGGQEKCREFGVEIVGVDGSGRRCPACLAAEAAHVAACRPLGPPSREDSLSVCKERGVRHWESDYAWPPGDIPDWNGNQRHAYDIGYGWAWLRAQEAKARAAEGPEPCRGSVCSRSPVVGGPVCQDCERMDAAEGGGDE